MSKCAFSTLLVEDDPYASNMMLMLLARDYRTQVVSVKDSLELFTSLNESDDSIPQEDQETILKGIGIDKPVDVVVLNADVPGNVDLPFQLAEKISVWPKPPKILCTSIQPNVQAIEKFMEYGCFSGYLIKSEVSYSLASAVCLAAEGYCVITPEVRAVAEKEMGRKKFPPETLILNSLGMEMFEEFDETGKEILLLGLVFNLPQHDISDELVVTNGWVAKRMSQGYAHLQIPDVASGDTAIDELFSNLYIDSSKLVRHFQEILKDVARYLERRKDETKSPKFREMSTLAFHLLTRPNIQKWN